jgi:hypothetical protein
LDDKIDHKWLEGSTDRTAAAAAGTTTTTTTTTTTLFFPKQIDPP